MHTIGIIAKRSKPEASELGGRVASWLRERGLRPVREAANDVPGADPLSSLEFGDVTELVVVLGGDGTLLHAARLTSAREVPILGVNLGTLGFMTEVAREQVFEALERVISGDFSVSRRTKLHVRVERDGQTLIAGEVLNDVVVNKNALARIADIEVEVDGERLTTFLADGIIVATPTGSSAYALAAGGPLVHPSVRAMLLVPICPHTLSQRPLVIPDEQVLHLTLTSDGEMFVTLDGQSGVGLLRGDRIVVKRSELATLLVRHAAPSYYKLLRSKLKWGGR